MAKRRAFTPDFRAQVALEELVGIKDKAETCREYRLTPQVFSREREKLLERESEVFVTERSPGNEQEQIDDLEQTLGRLTMELEAARQSTRYFASDNVLTSFRRKRELIDMLVQKRPLTAACEVLGGTPRQLLPPCRVA